MAIHLDSPDEIFFGLSESTGADVNFLVLPLLVILATVIMAGLAVPLGPLLTSMPPLRAYSLDILGSMTGHRPVHRPVGRRHAAAGRGSSSSRSLPRGSGSRTGSRARRSSRPDRSSASSSWWSRPPPPNQTWSPYYRIDEYDSGGIKAIDVNGIPHQAMWPTDRLVDPFYEQVYRWFPDRTFERVLIVGAGTGTDVAVALEHGAGHVDAVEIDPAIQAIGVRDHPDRPYDDPRVTRIVDDGRAFLRRTTDRYDLVVFALPDSLTLVSTSANLRLESFLFTAEAFREVRDHLAVDGIFVLYNFYREDWLPQKIGGDAGGGVRVAAHRSVLRRLGGDAGSRPAGGGPRTARRRPASAWTRSSLANAPQAATDDWPFLYLREPFIAPYYLGAIAIIIAFAVLLVARAAARSGTSIRRFSPHFFVLGIAFLLLETRSLVTFSLLFGTTWLVNSLVFFAVLASVLLAIVINARFRFRSPWLLYAGLFGSIALTLLLPPSTLLIEPAWLRYALAAGARLRPGLLREPRVQLLVPRHADRGHGVRVEPAGGDGRRRRRVRRADHRLRLPARRRGPALPRRVAARDPLPLPRRRGARFGDEPRCRCLSRPACPAAARDRCARNRCYSRAR